MKKFSSAAEVKEYVSGEKIICLVCWKPYAMLCTHLRVHGINESEYREKYDIPPSVKLVVGSVRSKMSASNKTPHEVLVKRADDARHLSKGKSVPHKFFHQRLAEIGRTTAAASKTKIDPEKVKQAHDIYMQKSQRAACEFLGVKAPTLHKWFARLGLPQKYGNALFGK